VAAIYLLWGFQQVFHGEPTAEDTTTRDLSVNERLIVAPLMVLIVLLGVFPKPVLDRITPSVDRLVIHVDQVTHTPVPADLRNPVVAIRTPGSATSANRATGGSK
jgi:NADH-quinone oxidoreductase subunit M